MAVRPIGPASPLQWWIAEDLGKIPRGEILKKKRYLRGCWPSSGRNGPSGRRRCALKPAGEGGLPWPGRGYRRPRF